MGLWPILADDRLKYGRYGPLKSLVSPKIFLSSNSKNWWFYLKKTSPPPKKALFFGGGVKLHVHLIQVWLVLDNKNKQWHKINFSVRWQEKHPCPVLQKYFQQKFWVETWLWVFLLIQIVIFSIIECATKPGKQKLKNAEILMIIRCNGELA